MIFNKRVVITGADGVVGTALGNLLNGAALLGLSNKSTPPVDIRDYPALKSKIKDFAPQIIIHLAAKTDVDWCENNPDECYSVNTQGTENICKVAAELGSSLLYASTLYVYSGDKDDAYDERFDFPDINALKSVYARSKLIGERKVTDLIGDRSFIVRFGAVFGGGIKDKKFVRKLLDKVKKEKVIRVVSDRTLTLAYADDIARNIKELIKTNLYGIYNMVNHGRLTYYDYAAKIIEYAGIRDVKLIPVPTDAFKEDALRPRTLYLVNGKLKEAGLDFMRPWQVALKEYIDSLKKDGLL